MYIKNVYKGLVKSDLFDEIRVLILNQEDLKFFKQSNKATFLFFPPLFSFREQWSMQRLACEKDLNVYFSPHVTFPWKPFCPTVITIHDLIWLKYPNYTSILKRYYFRKMLKRACKVCSKIICVSENTKKDVVNFLKADPSKCVVIYNGVETDFPKTKPNSEPNLNYWLYVGTWKPWKRVSDLICAFNIYMKKRPKNGPEFLILAGHTKTSFAENVRFLIKNSCFKNHITILENIPDDKLETLYKNAFCLVHPSEYEGFGFTILEAMNFGVPVIATTGGSIPEITDSAAVLVPPRSSVLFAKKMIEMTKNKQKRFSLIKKGKARALSFSWKASRLNHLRLFNLLINQRSI